MNITKFGHSCLLIEEGGVRFLIDPGKYSTLQNEVKNLDAILITHEHLDHTDPESIKIILENNPGTKIYTNKGVGKVLAENGIVFELLEHGQSTTVKNVLIEAFGKKHAVIHPDLPIVDDTGYMIAEKFFYPGDAWHIPPKPVEILALTLYAPWTTFAQTIDYARNLKPKVCFPVHDSVFKFQGFIYQLAPELLKDFGIVFKILEEGKEHDFI